MTTEHGRVDLDFVPITSIDQIDEVLAVEDSSFINPWTREMYAADLANRDVSHVVLTRQRGVAVAFCSFWIVLDELHLNNLAVLPEHRRAGIGSRLVEYVLTEGRRFGARRATLEVRRSNEPAIRLYTRWGFLVAGVRRNYYSQPVEDALILWHDNLPIAVPTRWPAGG
jgi:ribosomal-protein-alanine N-acetyltransferase